jgi:hypothetical protein
MALLLALVVASGPAHAADPSFRRVKEARLGRYFAAPGLPGGVDVKRSEAFLERLHALFGRAPAGFRVEYYRHRSLAALREHLGFAAVGATDVHAARIDSVRPFHPHELVHAVACRIGRTPPLFEEGLAEALTTDRSRSGEPIEAVALRFLDGRGRLDALVHDFAAVSAERDYAVAASFVAFLLDRGGIEPFVAYLSRCGNGEPWEAALRAEYGKRLGALEHEWSLHLRAGGVRRPWHDPKSWPASRRTIVTAIAEANPTAASGRFRTPSPLDGPADRAGSPDGSDRSAGLRSRE